MRQRRFRWSAAAAGLKLVAAAGFGTIARAQTGAPFEGALQFLLPAGARSIGMGEAAVALSAGSEGLWWNPAVASRGPRDFSFHISNTVATSDGGADFATSALFPVRGVGAFGVGFRYTNFGQIAASDTSDVQTGTFENVSYIVTGTFAAPFGDRFAAGISIKFLQLTYPCTGTCNAPTTPPRTGALDLGAQYIVSADSTIIIGAAVRSIGLRLQINDSPQADPLPTRFDAGVGFAPKSATWPKEIRVRGSADIITRISGGGGPGYRFGAEIGYLDRLHARAGYIVHGTDGGTGPTIGFGFSTGRLQIDFAQARSDVTSQAGKQPSYLSLKYGF